VCACVFVLLVQILLMVVLVKLVASYCCSIPTVLIMLSVRSSSLILTTTEKPTQNARLLLMCGCYHGKLVILTCQGYLRVFTPHGLLVYRLCLPLDTPIIFKMAHHHCIESGPQIIQPPTTSSLIKCNGFASVPDIVLL